jgi:hypothetical protein
MHYRNVLVAAAATIALAACGHGGGGANSAGTVPVADLVPVSDVVNALKCELAETFHGRNYVGTGALIKPTVKGSLSLGVAVARETGRSGGISPTIGVVEASGTGGLTRGRKASNSLKVAFSYDVSNDLQVPAFCRELARDIRVDGNPFVTLLDGLKKEHAELQRGAPKVTLSSLEYTSGFEVETKKEGGLEVTILVFKIGATRSRTSTSSQELTLEFETNLEAVVF